MIYDASQDPRYVDYVCKLTGTESFGECRTIAFLDDDLLAVVLYSGKDEMNIMMAIASSTPKWCTRWSLKVAFGFPFIQLGLNRITTYVRAGNAPAIRLNEGLGFSRVGELENYYESGESAMIYGMTKDKCRWLK